MSTASERLAQSQAAGFPVGGEPLAVDLADTLVTVTDPHTDLLSDEDRCARWWSIQSDRLPPGAVAPGLEATRLLRNAIRGVLDGVLGSREEPAALETVNRAAAGAPSSVRLVGAYGSWSAHREYFCSDPSAVALGVVATSLIEVLSGPSAKRLRRCGNPACSMLFVAEDARRKWCTQNICGNRVRVARHYRRHLSE